MPSLQFTLNGRLVVLDAISTNTTLLQYLRSSGHPGTKEGCAEGDCGACSVALLDSGPGDRPAWRAVNSCLIFLPMLNGREVWSVEGLASGDQLHPAQQALVQRLGSQCGYCTPGVVMSLFETCYRQDLDVDWKVDDQLCGNLCRCTGYRPIREAALSLAEAVPKDHFSERLQGPAAPCSPLHYDYQGQSYYCPNQLADLWQAMKAHPEARLIAGGTDLALTVTKHFQPLPQLISLEGLNCLRGTSKTDHGLRIGATTTLSQLEASAATELPLLARMLRFFASRQIKNRATVGGNLCNASPIGDLAPVLMALNAELVLLSDRGERRVPLDRFFLDYRHTALQPGEILAAVEVPRPGTDWRLGAYKVSKRRELDISAVCAGMAVQIDPKGTVVEARLCYGGMAATTRRATKTEEALRGRPWTLTEVEQAASLTAEDFAPINDQRGSQWFRATLARNLLIGFFHETREQSLRKLPERPSSTLVLS